MNRSYELEKELEKLQKQNQLLKSQGTDSGESYQQKQANEETKQQVSKQVEQNVKEDHLDGRDTIKSSTRISNLALLSLMSALGSETQCSLVADYCQSQW